MVLLTKTAQLKVENSAQTTSIPLDFVLLDVMYKISVFVTAVTSKPA